MSIKCKLGFHSWDGCKCNQCGKTRDEQHDWKKDCEKCSKCGKTRENEHNWNGCKCTQCSKTRDEQHDWSKDCEKCFKCGKTRDGQHDWSKDSKKCSNCGKSSIKLIHLAVLPIQRGNTIVFQAEDKSDKCYNLHDITQATVIYIAEDALQYFKNDDSLWKRVRNKDVKRSSIPKELGNNPLAAIFTSLSSDVPTDLEQNEFFICLAQHYADAKFTMKFKSEV